MEEEKHEENNENARVYPRKIQGKWETRARWMERTRFIMSRKKNLNKRIWYGISYLRSSRIHLEYKVCAHWYRWVCDRERTSRVEEKSNHVFFWQKKNRRKSEEMRILQKWRSEEEGRRDTSRGYIQQQMVRTGRIIHLLDAVRRERTEMKNEEKKSTGNAMTDQRKRWIKTDFSSLPLCGDERLEM